MKINAQINIRPSTQGGRSVFTGWKPTIVTDTQKADCKVIPIGKIKLLPGEQCRAEITITAKGIRLFNGAEFHLHEGFNIVATGMVTQIICA